MGDSEMAMNPDGGANGRRRPAQPALNIDLMEQVLAAQNLRRAWKRVKANRGAPGTRADRPLPAGGRDGW